MPSRAPRVRRRSRAPNLRSHTSSGLERSSRAVRIRSRKIVACRRRTASEPSASSRRGQGIGPGHVEQAMRCRLVGDVDRKQRFGDQGEHAFQGCRRRNCGIGDDGNRRVHVELATEDGQSAKRDLLVHGQQAVAPVERGVQCLMPRLGGAATQGQQLKAALQPGGQSAHAEGWDMGGGQLDRQGNAVELPADARDVWRIEVAHGKGCQPGRRPLDEELDARIGNRLACGQLGAAGRHIERVEAIDPLAGRPQRLAAGGQQAHARAIANQGLRHFRNRRDLDLAGVEDDEDVHVAQMSREAGQRAIGRQMQLEDGRQRPGHQMRIGRGGKIDQSCAIGGFAGEAGGNRGGDGGFSHPPGRNDADEAALAHMVRNAANRLVAADHAPERFGQIVALPGHDASLQARRSDRRVRQEAQAAHWPAAPRQ